MTTLNMTTDFDFDALLKPEEEEEQQKKTDFDFDALLRTEADDVDAPLDSDEEVSDEEVNEVTQVLSPPPPPKNRGRGRRGGVQDAFGPAGAVVDVISKDEEDTLSFQELSSDVDYMEMLREYSEDRLGEEGKQQENETDQEYLERFLSHTREFEFNSIDLGQQLDWVRNASEEERMKFGYLYSQLDKLPSFYEEGGTSAISAMRDFGKALLTDPLNYIGFGAGAVAKTVGTRAIVAALKQGGKKAAIEEAAKLSAKKMLSTKAGKIAAGGIAVEAGVAGVADLKLQEVEILSKKYGNETPEEKSLMRAGLVSAVGLGAGALGTKLSGGLSGNKLLQNARDARAKQLKISRGLNSRLAAEKKEAAADAVKRTAEATSKDLSISNSNEKVFDTEVGRQTLNMLGEQAESGLTEAQFRTELMQRMGKVVTNIVEDLAESGKLGSMVDADIKASELIGKIVTDSLKGAKGKGAEEVRRQTVEMLRGTDTKKGLVDELAALDIDADTLESAISKAGITNKQFVDAFGTSFSDAGKYLQTASKVGKILKGIREVDEELAEAIIGNKSADTIIGPMGKAHGFIQRLDRERRALMVTQVSTTVRNVATAGVRLTMDTAADLMESALYQIGRGADAGMTGNAPTVAVQHPTSIIRDAFGKVARLAQVTDTADLADALLKHNPRLANRMDRSLQEVGSDQSLSDITRTLNGLNIAQDLFFRRAIFTDSIDKRMRRAGVIVDNPGKGQFKSLEEFAASGRALPAKVLADAVDDSLAFTFARMPKPGTGKAGDTVGHYFIKFNEAIGPVPGPVGTAAFPFARFMVNALQFQMKYMPTSLVTAGYRTMMGTYTKRLAAASEALGKTDLSKKQALMAQRAFDEARQDFSKGIMGSAALYMAVQYRANNQDIKFYQGKNDDGSTTDLRPFFPLTPYLALADVIVKSTSDQPAPIDGKEFLEAFTGAQFRTGASSFIIDNFAELLKEKDARTTERIYEMVGGYVGELFGAAATPLRVVRDIQAAYDTEAAIVRDAKQTDGVSAEDRFVSALKNTVVKDLPELSKSLPALESPTREGDIYRQSPLAGQIMGGRREAQRNAAEIEFDRFGIKRFQIVPGSGDKVADAAVKKSLGPIVEKRISELVTSERYLNKSDNKKRAMLNEYMKMYRSRAKQIAEIEAKKDKSKPFTPFDRAQYTKMSDLATRLADEYYMNHPDYGGRTVLEMQEFQPNVNHLKKAIAIGRRLARTAE